MKYLPLYYKWAESGYIPRQGLCNCFPESPLFDRFNTHLLGYWGYQGRTEFLWCVTDEEANDILKKFTPLRQNIVLFMAAMNREL